MYIYRFDGVGWIQQAYVKASNTDIGDFFGLRVSLDADGSTLAVAAPSERSNATGINGNQSDNSLFRVGAAYVFRFDGADWSQQAYIKAPNADERDSFGYGMALSAGGNTLGLLRLRNEVARLVSTVIRTTIRSNQQAQLIYSSLMAPTGPISPM